MFAGGQLCHTSISAGSRLCMFVCASDVSSLSLMSSTYERTSVLLPGFNSQVYLRMCKGPRTSLS